MGSTKQLKVTHFKVKAIGALMVSVWGLPTVALELGRLQLQSAIGEPLRAEIDIAKALPDELRTLRVQLASPESFRKVGMEFNPALRGVSTTLRVGSNGSTVIVLNGRVPVQDNFIDLVIESQWATGNMVKNYAVLLNSVSDKNTASAAPALQLPITPSAPDTASARSAAASRLNPSSVEINAQKVPVYRFDPVDNNKAAAAPVANRPLTTAPPPPSIADIAPAVQTPPPPPRSLSSLAPAVQGQLAISPNQADANSVVVLPGDTASRLAVRHLTANISLDQMLLAMLKANPEAFIEGNVNLIKAGAVLRMPSADEAAQISRGEARQTVIAQTRDFAAYARRLAESPMLISSRNTREMTGKVGVDVHNADGQVPQQDKLTLTKPQIGTDSAEAKLAAQRESADKASQLANLNKNVKDLETLASGGAASANGGIATAPAAPASTPQEAGTTAITAPTPVVAPLPTPEASTPGFFNALLERTQQNKDIWIWAATLLGLMLLLVLWVRKKTQVREDVFAPSYNDINDSPIEPSSHHAAAPAPADPGIPPQMASIDLSLNPAGAPPSAPLAQPVAAGGSPAEETERNKLNLAQQLMAKGDHDLARALILSVVSSTSGDLKSRALQMLGQIR